MTRKNRIISSIGLGLFLISALAVSAPAAPAADQPVKPLRPLKVDDLFALKDVYDPQLSPDGAWVAYTVTATDLAKETSDTDVWMVPTAGGDPVRVTSSPKSESRPRFSPDGKWLAFLSAREGKRTQVWLLPRSGGEAVKLTDFKTGVSDVVWSPDSKRLALVMKDADPDGGDTGGDDEEEDAPAGDVEKPKTPKPIVVRRLQFKRDGAGYLDERRRHIHIFDIAGKTAIPLTSGPFDDSSPVWSPDGTRIAFVSNRTLPDADASQDRNIYVVEAKAGSVPRAVVASPGEDDSPAWSPDGRWLLYLQGCDPKDMWYGSNHIALVPAGGGTPRPLTASIDRNAYAPVFSPDSLYVYFLLEDGGNQPLCRVSVDGGTVERVAGTDREVQDFDVAGKGPVVVLEATTGRTAEISAVGTDGTLTRLTHVNDEVLKGIKLGEVRRYKATSKDGTPVDAFLTLPPDYKEGTKLPAILRIHGGPTSQFTTGFDFEWHILAAQGYAIITSNPRGSTGYGTAFSRAIFADWGNKDFEDVMAAVDGAVAMGIADPDRLGVGGWSYGGIQTDYVITKTDRFKAAIAGASGANWLAGYGTDHYQYEYETELGLPWRNRDLWLKLSSSFFDVEKITTPVLYMCGALDMNVPLLNSEQLYQAVRRIGKVRTELVIYPDQWHGIATPSYQKDRYERYIAWYDSFLKPKGALTGERKPEAMSLLGKPLYPAAAPADRKKVLEDDLAKATSEFVKNPDSDDAILRLGLRTADLGRYREAIDIYSRGISRHPDDARLLRYRGHRYITVREFDKAIADLARAAGLIKGKPDIPDTSGAVSTAVPGASSKPANTLRFSVWYHLGLARFLKGDFQGALQAYRECLMAAKGNDESLVAVSDWLYMTLRRLGRKDEAAKALDAVRPDMKISEDMAYLNRLLMYKGIYAPEDLLRTGGSDVDLATYGFGVGNFYLMNGEKDKARAIFEQVMKGPAWQAFGYIAAEAELARMK
jgi:dipeptidyl aminopeptidase/acylaminoacyl peptidase